MTWFKPDTPVILACLHATPGNVRELVMLCFITSFWTYVTTVQAMQSEYFSESCPWRYHWLYMGQTTRSTTTLRRLSRCRIITILFTAKKNAKWCPLWKLVSVMIIFNDHAYPLTAALWRGINSVVPTSPRSLDSTSRRYDEAWRSWHVSLYMIPYQLSQASTQYQLHRNICQVRLW
jgi:hypothetical protein